ncbi:MAG: CoA-binding protein [Ignavibacterium sp.]
MNDFLKILKEVKTIAVVGISDKPNRPSKDIANFLVDKGYDVVGVHPILKEIDGILVYKSLKDIPHKIDLVDVFLNSERVPSIIPDVLEIKPNYLWLQLGIRNDEAIQPALESGIEVIQDHCIKIEYMKYSNYL